MATPRISLPFCKLEYSMRSSRSLNFLISNKSIPGFGTIDKTTRATFRKGRPAHGKLCKRTDKLLLCFDRCHRSHPAHRTHEPLTRAERQIYNDGNRRYETGSAPRPVPTNEEKARHDQSLHELIETTIRRRNHMDSMYHRISVRKYQASRWSGKRSKQCSELPCGLPLPATSSPGGFTLSPAGRSWRPCPRPIGTRAW